MFQTADNVVPDNFNVFRKVFEVCPIFILDLWFDGDAVDHLLYFWLIDELSAGEMKMILFDAKLATSGLFIMAMLSNTEFRYFLSMFATVHSPKLK